MLFLGQNGPRAPCVIVPGVLGQPLLGNVTEWVRLLGGFAHQPHATREEVQGGAQPQAG